MSGNRAIGKYTAASASGVGETDGTVAIAIIVVTRAVAAEAVQRGDDIGG